MTKGINILDSPRTHPGSWNVSFRSLFSLDNLQGEFGDSSDPENELAIQGLLANVDHLKSQLRLSYMMVRAQETTIQAQQVTIASQQRMLSGEVLLDSLNTGTARAKPEDKEEVIDGILALGQYADKGVTVNLGELYRRLKKLFKKDG